MSDPAVKAAGMNTMVEVVRSRAPAADFHRAVQAMAPEGRALVEHPPLPLVWVPLAIAATVENAMGAALGQDWNAIVEAAAEATKRDLGTIYRVFMKVASPKYVTSRAAALYTTYTRDAGTMRVTAEGDSHAEVTLEGVVYPTEMYYACRRGNILGALRATGARNVRCEMVKGGNTETYAVYRGSWG